MKIDGIALAATGTQHVVGEPGIDPAGASSRMFDGDQRVLPPASSSRDFSTTVMSTARPWLCAVSAAATAAASPAAPCPTTTSFRGFCVIGGNSGLTPGFK